MDTPKVRNKASDIALSTALEQARCIAIAQAGLTTSYTPIDKGVSLAT